MVDRLFSESEAPKVVVEPLKQKVDGLDRRNETLTEDVRDLRRTVENQDLVIANLSEVVFLYGHWIGGEGAQLKTGRGDARWLWSLVRRTPSFLSPIA